MAGIKETKELMLFSIGLAEAIDSVTQDGWQLKDIFTLIPPLSKLPGAIIGIEDVPEEIADLDEAERAELVEAIKELDFVSNNSEAIAEQAIRVGVELGNLIQLMRKD